MGKYAVHYNPLLYLPVGTNFSPSSTDHLPNEC